MLEGIGRALESLVQSGAPPLAPGATAPLLPPTPRRPCFPKQVGGKGGKQKDIRQPLNVR